MVVIMICQRCELLIFLDEQLSSPSWITYSSLLSNIYLNMSRQKINKRKKLTTYFSFDTELPFTSSACFRHKHNDSPSVGFADICLKTLNNNEDSTFQLCLHKDKFYYVFIKNDDQLVEDERYAYFVGKSWPIKFSKFYTHWLVDFSCVSDPLDEIREQIINYNVCSCED